VDQRKSGQTPGAGFPFREFAKKAPVLSQLIIAGALAKDSLSRALKVNGPPRTRLSQACERGSLENFLLMVLL